MGLLARRAALVFMLLVFALAAPMRARCNESRLVVETASGPVEFTAELAITPAEQARGLMFRNTLAERHGMLFDFGKPREVTMWMKNTLISLDMLFIRADGTIHRIAEHTEPLSLDTISSNGDVKAVFEIAGGSAAALGIKAGDTVRHAIFPAE